MSNCGPAKNGLVVKPGYRSLQYPTLIERVLKENYSFNAERMFIA
jgi:hypothetical protein